jgi:hypothetical protein
MMKLLQLMVLDSNDTVMLGLNTYFNYFQLFTINGRCCDDHSHAAVLSVFITMLLHDAATQTNLLHVGVDD